MNVAVFGAKGRVGSAVVRLAKGHNVWQIDKDFEHNPLQTVDVVVDFSLPSATKNVVDFCKAHHCPLVTGVTGHSVTQLDLTSYLNTLPLLQWTILVRAFKYLPKFANTLHKTATGHAKL